MTKEELIKAREMLIDTISSSHELSPISQAELMINIDKFFDINKYEENIKVLRREQSDTRFIR